MPFLMNEWLSSPSWLWTLSSLNWLLSSSVGCIRGFPCPYVIFPLIPGGKECLRQSQATGNLSPGTRAQNAVDARDNTDYVLGNPCGPFVEAFRTQKPHRQTRPSVDREAGPGGGGTAGAPVSGASHSTKQAAGRRPRAPIFARQPLAVAVTDLQLPSPSPPRPARPPACPPAFLSPLSLRTGRPGSISGLRIFGIDRGRGRESRWLRRGSWAASLGRRDGSPAAFVASPSAPAAPPPGRRALPAGLCAASGAAAARGAALGAGGGGEAGGEGRPGPWPNMAEVTIDQSKLPGVKEGRARGARRAGPLPSPSLAVSGRGRRPFGPRGPRSGPSGALAPVPWPGTELTWGSTVVPWASHYVLSPVSPVRGNGGREDSSTLSKWLCKCSGEEQSAEELGKSDLFVSLKIEAQPRWLEG